MKKLINKIEENYIGGIIIAIIEVMPSVLKGVIFFQDYTETNIKGDFRRSNSDNNKI